MNYLKFKIGDYVEVNKNLACRMIDSYNSTDPTPLLYMHPFRVDNMIKQGGLDRYKIIDSYGNSWIVDFIQIKIYSRLNDLFEI